MSRYWVFTEEQLDEALRTTTGGQAIREFLNSSFCVSTGMARDIAAPTAPEIRVFPRAGESESILTQGAKNENAE